jgi:ATPase subunit of ABC transporter with duplicated ATPase domains
MIGTRSLAKSFGARTLFADVSLKLNAGSRYGLVGANGSGKTTFLKILAGDEPASDGSVSLSKGARMGVLRQDRFLDDAAIILDLAMAGDQVVTRAREEQRHTADAARIAELEDVIAAHDGYTLEARAAAVLVGLGIPDDAQRRPLSTLSGGFKLRVLLAQVLVGNPEILLLDEPTNHLDILSIRWLEKFLAAYRGCAVVISHDMRFLDNVATHVLDVDYETITAYVGNYSAFVVEKEGTRARKEAEIARQEEIVAEKQAFVDRFRAKATKARQAQSRIKQIEKIEIEELARTSRRTPHFRFEEARKSGKEVLTAKGVAKAYGAKKVLDGVSLEVRRGDKIAVIGPNGLGKSTLLKILVGSLERDGGEVSWGYEARVGYFAQDHKDLLGDPAQTALDYLWSICPREPTTFVRGMLGKVLFSGDDVEKTIGTLSGGEGARLVFARLMVEKANVLVLDEPTNHLDLEAIVALAEALARYEGTILFVSHDRWFVSRLATRILELTPGGPRAFDGSYAEYLERCGDDHLDADAVVLRAKEEKRKVAPEAFGASWEEQKRERNRRKDLPQKRDRVLLDIESAEARKKAIHDAYASPGFFERTPKDEIERMERESATLDDRIAAFMAEWEALERAIAEA